jgi:hypothetical protein
MPTGRSGGDAVNTKFWIRHDGRLFAGEYHTGIASKIFPHAKNPEYACEKAGYLKVYKVQGGLRAMLTGYETQAQLNVLDRLSETNMKGNL